MGRRAERQRVMQSDSKTDGKLTGRQTDGQNDKWDAARQKDLEAGETEEIFSVTKDQIERSLTRLYKYNVSIHQLLF